MRRIALTSGLAALGLCCLPGSAPAADTVIGTVERGTAVDAYGGRVVWSRWDPAARAFRLVEHFGGVTRAVRVPPAGGVFDVDLGPGRRGGAVAVYRRCRRGASPRPFDLDGRRGCDLHLYDFTTGKRRKLRGASSRHADEYAPAVWRNRVAFVRLYPRRRGRPRVQVYWRRLDGRGRTRRLRQGPTRQGGIPTDLDLRGRRAPFFWELSFGGYVRLAATTGSFRHVLAVPGSGAATLDYGVRGVSAVRGHAYWALLAEAGEVWRYDPVPGNLWRATVRLSRFLTGFAQDGDVSYYVRPRAEVTCGPPSCETPPYDVHRLDSLEFEPAPPLELK